MPLSFIIFDAVILMVSVIRVWRALRQERMVLLNEKFMVLHCVLLFFLASDSLWVFYPLENGGHVGMAIWTGYLIADFIVSCLIAFIMWQVAGKKTITDLDKSMTSK